MDLILELCQQNCQLEFERKLGMHRIVIDFWMVKRKYINKIELQYVHTARDTKIWIAKNKI